MNYDGKDGHEDQFEGNKAFEIMREMSKEDILEFLELTKNDEDPEYPYIKEYRRFLTRCFEDKDKRKHSSHL